MRIYIDAYTGTWGDPEDLVIAEVTDEQFRDMCDGRWSATMFRALGANVQDGSEPGGPAWQPEK